MEHLVLTNVSHGRNGFQIYIKLSTNVYPFHLLLLIWAELKLEFHSVCVVGVGPIYHWRTSSNVTFLRHIHTHAHPRSSLLCLHKLYSCHYYNKIILYCNYLFICLCLWLDCKFLGDGDQSLSIFDTVEEEKNYSVPLDSVSGSVKQIDKRQIKEKTSLWTH